MVDQRTQHEGARHVVVLQIELIAGFDIEAVGQQAGGVEGLGVNRSQLARHSAGRRVGPADSTGSRRIQVARTAGVGGGLVDAVRGRDGILAAEGGEAGEAQMFHVLQAQGRDNALHLDAVVVNRGLEARDEVRLPHDTDFGRLRLFRLQQGVAFVDLANALARLAGELVVDRAVQALRGREQFRQVGGTNVARLQGADTDAGDRRIPGDTHLPGIGVAGGGVPRVTASDLQVGLAPEVVVDQRHADFQEHFVHMEGTTAIVVVAGVPGAQAAQRGLAAIHEGIGARLGGSGRGRGGDTGRVGVGTLRIMLFAILITGSDGDRAGPVFNGRTIDDKVEGFLTLGLDRARSKRGAARAVLVVEIGDGAVADIGAAEGIERRTTIKLGDGIAANDVAGRINHGVLRQVEARQVVGDGRTGIGGRGRIGRGARKRHVVDLDRGVGFAVFGIRLPVPALAEQVEGAIGAHDVTALGAQQEHFLVQRDIGPLAGIADVAGRIGSQASRVGLGSVQALAEQAGGRQIGIVALQRHAGLVGVALGRGVLGTADAIVQGGIDFRGRRQVIRQAHIDVAAGQGIVQALGELAGVVLVARAGRRANAGIVDGVDETAGGRDSAVAGQSQPLGLAVATEGGEGLRAAGDQAIGRVTGALGDVVVGGTRLAGRRAGVAAIGDLARLAGQGTAADIARQRAVLRGDRPARQQAVAVGVFARDFEVGLAAHEAGTGRGLHGHVAHVAIGRKTRHGVHLEAFELLVGHEVDDARHGVRAPGGRRTAGHNVHALDQHLRHLADVNHAVEVAADDALTVQQHQGAQGGQAAQTKGGQADQAGGGGAGVVANASRALEGGQLGDGVEHAGLGRRFKVGSAHDRRGGRGIETGALQAGRGDHNLLDTRFLRQSSTGAERQNGCTAGKADASLRQTIIHRIFPLERFYTGTMPDHSAVDSRGSRR